MDPWTLGAAALIVGLRVVARLTIVRAETRRLRARTELVRAVVDLTPGTEVTGGFRGAAWVIRVPAKPVAAPDAPGSARDAAPAHLARGEKRS